MNVRRSVSSLAISMVVMLFSTLSPAATQTLLHSFAGGSDGSNSVTPLVSDAAGNLYGTTQLGGGGTGCNEGAMGCGVIFEVSPPSGGGDWTEKILYSFTGGSDGAFPSGLAFDANGNLFGTSVIGGSSGNGNVFELSPNLDGTWTESTVYSFNGGTSDGCAPFYGVTFDGSGNLFATTVSCGANSFGTVFELTPGAGGSWTETILYNIAGNADGSWPGVPTLDTAGNLYVTNQQGGGTKHGAGTVLELQPGAGGWTPTVLHTFSAGTDGFYPSSSLAIDSSGNLYGVTQAGGGVGRCGKGEQTGCGTAFRLARNAGAWKYQMLHRFAGKPSATPLGAPVFGSGGKLYGVCSGSGTVFSLAANGTGGVTFTNIALLEDGSFPDAAMISDSAGNLYGTTDNGGANNLGIVYEVTP